MEVETYEAPQLVLIGEAEELVQGSWFGWHECSCGYSWC
jgi:hypothetical protein